MLSIRLLYWLILLIYPFPETSVQVPLPLLVGLLPCNVAVASSQNDISGPAVDGPGWSSRVIITSSTEKHGPLASVHRTRLGPGSRLLTRVFGLVGLSMTAP